MEWEAQAGMSMFVIHLRRILWVYCPGHAGVKGNDRAERPAGKATVTGGLRLGRSEVLRSLRLPAGAQSQGHHTIDRLEERSIERGNAQRSSGPWKDEKGPSSIRPTLELFQKQHWENSWETGWSTYGLSRAHRYHLWTKLNWPFAVTRCKSSRMTLWTSYYAIYLIDFTLWFYGLYILTVWT